MLTPGAMMEDNIQLFKCPVCGEKMKMKEKRSIVCEKNHSFDRSRSGYVNLLLSPSKNEYDKSMLQSRHQICRLGFFDPLLEKLSRLIKAGIPGDVGNGCNLLDAGCGEGSHLARLTRMLQEMGVGNPVGVGIDISKAGIQIASKSYPELIWCVADLARIPFLSGQFHVILNILSPSNYEEFGRVMRGDGFVIKVVPGSAHLLELRRFFYDKTEKEVYSNERVVKHFEKHFTVLDMQSLQYVRVIDKESLTHLVKMTPLSWGAPEEKVGEIMDSGLDQITADFVILLGKKLGAF